MKAELKKKWIDALRSGSYEQGRHTLVNRSADGVSYCCLGVLLCVSGEYRRTEQFSNALSLISADRLDLLGGDSMYQAQTLNDQVSRMNDNGDSFASIANWIKRNVSAE